LSCHGGARLTSPPDKNCERKFGFDLLDAPRSGDAAQREGR
jgi:hypothetical protein